MPLGFYGRIVTANMAQDMVGTRFTLAPVETIVMLIVVVGLGLAAAAIPARRASQIEVLAALRYE